MLASWAWPLHALTALPTFLNPGPLVSDPKKGVTKVVEVFGNYWHSRLFTDKANFDHEGDLVEAFADIGIQCHVVWESEFEEDPVGVVEKVKQFLFASETST